MGGKKSAITNHIKALRKANGMSQQALADAIGATRQTGAHSGLLDYPTPLHK